MMIEEGDKLKYRFSEQLYRVKIFKHGTFVLQSEDPPDRTWIGDGDLDLFFEIVENRRK